MTQKVLITYASKLGSTTEVAQKIAETILQHDIIVDVHPIKEVTGISGYDTIIIGSAIRMGQWLPEAVDFVKRHQPELKRIYTAIFSVHILNQGDNPKSQKERQAYTAPIHKILTPKAEAFFAGKIDPTQLKFFERMLFKAVKSPHGDFRNWATIQNWAQSQI